MRHASLPVLGPIESSSLGLDSDVSARPAPGPSLRVVPAAPPAASPAASPGDAEPALPTVFSEGELVALIALARAVLPETAGTADRPGLPAAGRSTVARLAHWLAESTPLAQHGYRGLLNALMGLARVRHLRPLHELSDAELLDLCQSLYARDFTVRSLLRVLITPLKLAHADDPALYQRFGALYRSAPQVAPQLRPVAPPDLPRAAQHRTQRASELGLGPGEAIECDVVVIGSGAGGAVAAYELAAAGHAVTLLEEGEFFNRGDFAGSVFQQQRLLYREEGRTLALGNALIPIPVGRAVGGTTVINSGTCYRMPTRVYARWAAEHGLTELTPESLAEHYQSIEAVLGVEPAARHLLTGGALAIARGCEQLGYRHAPLRRNAPDCDGQGVCCFGCPTDAKRSTNVSFVPMALQAGASLITGARAERLLIEDGRAVGVVAGVSPRAGGAGQPGGRFTVRARAVIVACGALMSPVLLLGDPATRRALRRSRMLGANLSIHPAAAVLAMHREPVRAFAGIPQGYAIEEFHQEGLLMEGIFFPIDLLAASLTLIGPEYMRALAAYDRLSCFGFVVEDQGHGSVRPGPGGRPLIRYDVSDNDVARLRRGIDIISRVYLAAGAETVYTGVRGHEVVRSPAELTALRRATLKARDFELTAYHPLGTVRMGADPGRSVVGPDLQAHDLPGLYVCDGGVLPTSPAVNPQLTIMAVARRAARALADKLA
jgi:choline dehydrogenase-like flavoprotein